MAKINIVINTNPKSLSLDVDGTTIPDIVSIWIDRFVNSFNEESIHATFTTETKDRENKLLKTTTFSTMGSEFALKQQSLGKVNTKELSGFFSCEQSIDEDISKYFASKV